MKESNTLLHVFGFLMIFIGIMTIYSHEVGNKGIYYKAGLFAELLGVASIVYGAWIIVTLLKNRKSISATKIKTKENQMGKFSIVLGVLFILINSIAGSPQEYYIFGIYSLIGLSFLVVGVFYIFHSYAKR
ncbi:MAG: hypothetical protein R8G33_02515 [Gammaproteobacteria bacterium]|nr:hypothetical protein [Gammaproteobacteria bacterium]